MSAPERLHCPVCGCFSYHIVSSIEGHRIICVGCHNDIGLGIIKAEVFNPGEKTQ